MNEDIVVDPCGATQSKAADLIESLRKKAQTGEGWEVVYSWGVADVEGRGPLLVDEACGGTWIGERNLRLVAAMGNIQELVVASLRENAARRNHYMNPSVHSLQALNEALAESHRKSASIEKFLEIAAKEPT